MWTIITELFTLVIDFVLYWFWRILKGDH